MAKPLPVQNTFAGSAPPWSLTNLDANFTNLWGAVNDIGTYSNTLQDSGGVNALIANPVAGITFALVSGVTVTVIAANTTTTVGPTLNVNSTGAKAIVDNNGNAPPIGGIQANSRYTFIYDGTNWRCLNLSTGLSLVSVRNSTLIITNSTTFQTDALLGFTNVSLGIYSVDGLIMFNGAGGGDGGIKMTFVTGLSFGSNIFCLAGFVNGAALAVPGVSFNSGAALAPIDSSAIVDWVKVSGFLQVTTAGSISMQFAQQVASAHSLQIFNSYFNLNRIQ
jgi:hypothetical protein